MSKSILSVLSIAMFSLFVGVGNISAAILPPPVTVPTQVDDCKDEGWRNYGDLFKNQGDCVSFVVTDGRNAPDGPAKN